MNDRLGFILASLMVGVVAGCRSPGPRFDAHQAPPGADITNLISLNLTNRLADEWLRTPTNAFTLGPGDRVEIEVMGDATTRATEVVGPDGRLYYYLLPGMDVWGLTLAQTKDLLERGLAAFMRNHPRVSVTLLSVESKQVWLLGRLSRPGIYPLSAPLTLLEAIALAGGPAVPPTFAALSGGAVRTMAAAGSDEAADLHRSFIIRHGQLLPVDFFRLLREGDLAQNIYLQPDDFIYLPTAASREVYVLGAVGLPQAITFAGQMTLVSAIARAGGALTNAYSSHVTIVRGSLTEPRVAQVNYQAIVKGHETDVMLQPHDIVYVPFSPLRVLTRYVELALTTFARTIGANEGARVAMPNAGPTGFAVPIGF